MYHVTTHQHALKGSTYGLSAKVVRAVSAAVLVWCWCCVGASPRGVRFAAPVNPGGVTINSQDLQVVVVHTRCEKNCRPGAAKGHPSEKGRTRTAAGSGHQVSMVI